MAICKNHRKLKSGTALGRRGKSRYRRMWYKKRMTKSRRIMLKNELKDKDSEIYIG